MSLRSASSSTRAERQAGRPPGAAGRRCPRSATGPGGRGARHDLSHAWLELSDAQGCEGQGIGLHWKGPTVVAWADGRHSSGSTTRSPMPTRGWVSTRHPTPVFFHRIASPCGLTDHCRGRSGRGDGCGWRGAPHHSVGLVLPYADGALRPDHTAAVAGRRGTAWERLAHIHDAMGDLLSRYAARPARGVMPCDSGRSRRGIGPSATASSGGGRTFRCHWRQTRRDCCRSGPLAWCRLLSACP